MTEKEATLLKEIGSRVAGPRYTLSLPAEPEVTELLSSLVEQNLVESTSYVDRMDGPEMIRVCLTGRGWIRYKGSNAAT